MKVWIIRGRNKPAPEYYHTKECSAVSSSDRARLVEKEELDEDLEHCSHCAGTIERSKNPDFSTYRAALNAEL